MIRNPNGYQRWLQAGTLIFSGYYLIVMFIDWRIAAPNSLSPLYLVYFGGVILLLPLLAVLPAIPARLGRAYPVLMLVLMSLLPFVGVAFVLPQSGIEAWFAFRSSAGIYIRHWIPDLIVAILLAFAYGWIAVLLYTFLLTAFGIFVAVYVLPPDQLGNLSVLTVLTGIVLLLVGLIVDRIFQQMRRQQEALSEANMRLMNAATTVEDLAISRERNRMARDLHDTLAHSLSGLIVQLEAVDGYWDIDPKMARELLGQSMETARSGFQETRRALRALRAKPLEDLGLSLALEQLADDAAERAELNISVHLARPLPPLDEQTEECIFRVAQEAVANVIRHANARHLDLWLTWTNGRVTLNVHDDGIGFDPGRVEQRGRYGVPGMRERAYLAGGNLRITSAPDQGTTVMLELPVRRT